ncbi:MAG: class I SAM-dependent methyltransferase [Rhodocyclales bacterium]|nr:class I SAM-dependent methyltransferase [Rhodocyclales bacterium]
MLNKISDQEVVKLLNPTEESVALDSAEGKKFLSETRKYIVGQILRFVYARFRHAIRFQFRLKSNKGVKDLHESLYKMSAETHLGNFSNQLRGTGTYRINHKIVVRCIGAHAMACNRTILGNIIAQLSPKSICEVGAGSGSTIFYLASRFPDIRFTGYELAQSGVDLCKSLQEHGLYGTSYGQIYNLHSNSDDPIRQIKFHCASAYDISGNDKEYDLVYTFSALEQMAADLPKALAEIRRIAKNYVIFHEPFPEVNDFYGRLYLRAGDYFRSSVAEIERHGFRAIGIFDNLPIKGTYGYGILVAEVVE